MAEYIERTTRCETCLYNKNCQFLAKHRKAIVTGCTVYRNAADVVAVVRCRDCKHRGDEIVCPMCRERCCDDGDGHFDVWSENETKGNDFCSYGEKREEE